MIDGDREFTIAWIRGSGFVLSVFLSAVQIGALMWGNVIGVYPRKESHEQEPTDPADYFS